MSELQTENGLSAPLASEEKKAQAEKVLTEILRHMELPARLEVKDAPDGGISVALFFEGEVAGVQPGRRSHLLDALQFLANKVVNRPQGERRWITVGVGGHPQPRAPKPPPAAAPAKPPPAPKANGQHPKAMPAEKPAAAPKAPAAPDESALDVSPDPDITRLARELAEKSARFGRFYAVSPMKAEDRARVLKAAADVPGVRVKIEGEGRNRRVVFVPDKPTPMPSSARPVDDEDEDDGA